MALKSREALLTKRTVSISAFTISISLFGPSFTHSYIPLRQRETEQWLAALKRATISTTHKPVVSPAQVTLEDSRSNRRRRSKISPHTCHSLCYTLFTLFSQSTVGCWEERRAVGCSLLRIRLRRRMTSPLVISGKMCTGGSVVILFPDTPRL